MNNQKYQAPYINITDYCNQNCPFCFAREEMTSSKKKEMPVELVKIIANQAYKDNYLTMTLFGGEPTLHSEFDKIIDYLMKKLFTLKIFTNALLPPKSLETLLQYAPRIRLVVNVTTPGFIFNTKTRSIILDNIQILLDKKTPITLSIVDTYQNTALIESIIKIIPLSIIKQSNIKFGLNEPAANTVNPYSIKDFPKIGGTICKSILLFEKAGPPLMFRFNRPYRPCMFNKKDIRFLKKRGLDFLAEFKHCHDQKTSADLFHINSDSQVFKCYPLSNKDIYPLESVSSKCYSQLYNKFEKHQQDYFRTYVLPECRSCPFFGHTANTCSGPCIGFRINALKSHIKINN